MINTIALRSHHACPLAEITNLEIAGIAVASLFAAMIVLCAGVIIVQRLREAKARRDAATVPGGWIPSHVCVPLEVLRQ